MTKAPTIEVIESRLFVGTVADEIVASIADAIGEKGRCSLVLSGGSTPSSIYRTLAKPPHVDEIDWSKIDLYWGDERWVAHDHLQSNFRMTNETLLSQLKKASPRIHAVKTDLSSPKEAALLYEKEIRQFEEIGSDEIPSFDIVLLGIGEDGHTASLFPHCAVIDDQSSSLCAAVEHPDGSSRITLTPKAIFSAKRVFFITKGDSKAEVMQKVIEKAAPANLSDYLQTPALLYKTATGGVTFFLDSGAATKLNKSLS